MPVTEIVDDINLSDVRWRPTYSILIRVDGIVLIC